MTGRNTGSEEAYLPIAGAGRLTSTEDMTLDVLGGLELGRVRFREVSLKDGVAGHVFQVRSGKRMTQQVLGEECDQLCRAIDKV